MEMEVKRGRFRLSVLEDSAQDCEVQRRIEREVRIREGACKLLAACSQRDQALEASKTLLTSNSRILALMTQLQRMKEAQAMQRAERRSSDGESVDERLPCTGKIAISELHQCAVFCLLQVGTEIHDTDLVIVDRTLTDICFVEPVILGPKYHLLAQTSLTLCHIQNSFRTHDLTISDTETNPEDWRDVYSVLSGSDLKCYQQQDDTDSLETPLFTIPINKDTRVCARERDPALHSHSITIINQCGVETTHTILTYTSEDTHRWMEAFWQHFYDISQWKQCCNELMKIEEPKKMVLVTKQGSLYHEME
ncbi:hypothetical protein cypCar_00015515 [Cyprinus carpio]|nr:hypothetical protein cypCar_00015515 [Cyprinus carpio]